MENRHARVRQKLKNGAASQFWGHPTAIMTLSNFGLIKPSCMASGISIRLDQHLAGRTDTLYNSAPPLQKTPHGPRFGDILRPSVTITFSQRQRAP